MTTYLHCAECGNIFAEDDARVLWRGNGYGTTDVYACPECRSTELAEAERCQICGTVIVPGKTYCAACSEKFRKVWSDWVGKVMHERLLNGEVLSADYLECEAALVEWLQVGAGVI